MVKIGTLFDAVILGATIKVLDNSTKNLRKEKKINKESWGLFKWNAFTAQKK